MKKAMVVTVGTGTGPNRDEVLKGLAQAITTSVCNNRPDKVVFIVSERSKKETLPLILPNLEGTVITHTTVTLKFIDDIVHIYKKISECIDELIKEGFNNHDIIVDYTSGTKVMSAGAISAAIAFEVKKMSYISVKKEKGMAVKGTERYTIMEPVQILMQRKLDSVTDLFNAHRFETCIDILEYMRQRLSGEKERIIIDELIGLSRAYDLWDKFNHMKAAEILLEIKPSIVDISNNKCFLGLMKRTCENSENKIKDIEFFYIVDLINNSERRAEEGRYDDAVARLYRVFELLEQWHIRKMGICNEIDIKQRRYIIDVMKLDKNQLKYFEENNKIKEDKIKLGLFESYEFLAWSNHALGQAFIGDKELKGLLSERNRSILAHGLTSIKKMDYEKLMDKCNEYIDKYIDDGILDFKEFGKFPKINKAPHLLI